MRRSWSRGRVLLSAIVLLALCGGAAFAPAPRAAAADSQCFPETGHCVQGRFLDYWVAHGGLAINGYPLTDEIQQQLEDGKTYTVQYFERVRMEYHPENADPQYQVLLGQFGRALHPADPAAAARPGEAYFAATGHNLGGGFLAYWQANGGLAQFGYPLTEEFTQYLEDGKPYTVQYFERARFEYHPENQPPYDVELGQFGRRILALRTPGVVLRDDFSNPASGWPTGATTGGGAAYAGGGYQITLTRTDWVIRAYPNQPPGLADVTVDVDATVAAGGAQAGAGIVCRRVDANNHYLLRITGAGGYAIRKYQGGVWTTLASGTSPAIHTGNATNHLLAACVGSVLALVVNGQRVATVQDSTFVAGEVGLAGESFATSQVVVRFNAFVAARP
ncbi:MAG TPA: hypothetical protein VFL91_04935 [Thermomicrobiales bacterium]|nr:hypothetical protein [Thermomicrobiales bacterium]